MFSMWCVMQIFVLYRKRRFGAIEQTPSGDCWISLCFPGDEVRWVPARPSKRLLTSRQWPHFQNSPRAQKSKQIEPSEQKSPSIPNRTCLHAPLDCVCQVKSDAKGHPKKLAASTPSKKQEVDCRQAWASTRTPSATGKRINDSRTLRRCAGFACFWTSRCMNSSV